jgi:hypothetical protein
MVSPATPDRLASIPEPDALRRLISEQVARTGLLRRLRIALQREQRLKRVVPTTAAGGVVNASP